MLTLGVIADTHIPDRKRSLHPKVLPIYKNAKVDAILHAGDASVPKVITQLETIAPVHAVRGNRDLFGFRGTPYHRTLDYEGVSIGLTHGHGNWLQYIQEKIKYLIRGLPKISQFEDYAIGMFPDTNVVILGHYHSPVNRWQNGQLIFNPGSACCQNPLIAKLPPSIGLLHIDNGNVIGEIVLLE